ncbi:alkaline serine protease [Chitinispirillum alkaliphilum]|nr:alkaline serine protease [Chitinispirillum alkaliphilum]
MSDLTDAMHWIIEIADSLGMPCVINLSLGTQEGPHDGTSMIDRVIDSLSGPGRVFVGAVGNDGNDKVHLSLTMGSHNQGTFVEPVAGGANGSTFTSAIDIWGQQGNNFSADILILDTTTMDYLEGSLSLNTRFNRFYAPEPILLSNSITGVTDTLELLAYTEKSNSLNRKPHAKIVLRGKQPQYWLGVRLRGSGTLHMWNMNGRNLLSFDAEGFFDGNNAYSINEIGGTAHEVITVGYYASKTTVTRWDDHEYSFGYQLKDLAPWSSRGPTVDGRIKPELSAPGFVVTAAMSAAYDVQENSIVLWPEYPGFENRYVYRSGSSMAAPVVSGVVALMLQIDPLLTPSEIKHILMENAIRDQFTGEEKNNSWGAGKIDAFAAVNQLIGFEKTATRITHKSPAENFTLSRLGNNKIKIRFGSLPPEKIRLTAYNMNGRVLFSGFPSGKGIVDFPQNLAKGTIILRFQKDGRFLGERRYIFY